MRALDVVGSDVDNFECPRCGAHDRERHLLLYMERTGLLAELAGKVIVHFAPEARLSKRIEQAGPSRYTKCDLFPSGAEVQREDLLAMSFADSSVDLLIANHVLEHVPDDQQAIREVARVLRPGGHAILQTPFSAMLAKTWEDEGIVSAEARNEAYGQEDHVRLFGRDIFSRFEQAGLHSRVQSHAELLADVDPFELGVNPREPFFLYQR